jgi:26S proteasome regulatory subunit N11
MFFVLINVLWQCVDVFAMPQSGTGVSVEAVDPVFQQQMLEMLKQTNRYGVFFCLMILADQTNARPEKVVGWYHSHPGFGCWLSGVDVNTQQVSECHCSLMLAHKFCFRSPTHAQSFEALNPRAVAVVVDPIQSVKVGVHIVIR